MCMFIVQAPILMIPWFRRQSDRRNYHSALPYRFLQSLTSSESDVARAVRAIGHVGNDELKGRVKWKFCARGWRCIAVKKRSIPQTVGVEARMREVVGTWTDVDRLM